MAFVSAISFVSKSIRPRSSCVKRPRTHLISTRGRTFCMSVADDTDSNPRGQRISGTGGDGKKVASWQDELRLLLDPSMPAGVKQVLVQDLAKRFPEILKESNINKSTFNKSCKRLGLDGMSDVIRQIQDDILPDLFFNGPRYVARAAEELPKTFSRIASDSETFRAGMPTSMSREEMQREFRNIFNRTPEGLFTPDYKVLGTFEGYEIRQYPTLIIAETPMNPNISAGSTATEVENANAMGESFTNLAGFLFGKNENKTAMKMTTPVILSKGEPKETMSFIIGEYKSVEEVPKSLVDNVTLREQEGQIFAVSEFSGYVTQGEAKRQREKLLSMLSRDNVTLSPAGEDTYKCMIYNGPSTLPNLRRNEMMVEVVYAAESEAGAGDAGDAAEGEAPEDETAAEESAVSEDDAPPKDDTPSKGN